MFFGIGIYIVIAIFFAIHCVRTGRQIFWLFILFSFPLLGSLVYFFVEYLPEMRVGSKVNRASNVAVRVLDPSRELREAKAALELTPTAQNRMRLANALLADGDAREAATQFELCLQGPFANDADIGLAAARAHLASGNALRAQQLLVEIRGRQPDFRAETLAVLLAEALTALGDTAAAGEELRIAEQRFGGIEARAEYAIWAANNGDTQTAKRLHSELEKSWANWSSQTRSLHRPLMKRVERALHTLQP